MRRFPLLIVHLLPLQMLVDFLLELDGFHLNLRVVPLVILLGEGITVVQQEGTTQQLDAFSQLQVFGGVILIHLLRGDLQHTAGEGCWTDQYYGMVNNGNETQLSFKVLRLQIRQETEINC